jgi:hypothetical protein
MPIRYYLLVFILFGACKKYSDPAPFSDPRINNPYCNVPAALNYNWGFPGIPDNSLCIYPSTFFSGNYFYRDSTFDIGMNFLSQDSFPITITVVDTSRVNISGFCGTNVLQAKTDKFYKIKFDSTFAYGQHLCSSTDTVTGGGSKKDISDTATIKFAYTLLSDTGVSYHIGTATKQ